MSVQAQTEQLAAAYACHGEGPERGEQPVPGGRPEERLELFGCPRPRLGGAHRRRLRHVRREGDIAGDVLVVQRVGERGPNDEVDL
jgi:hypothetical protein